MLDAWRILRYSVSDAWDEFVLLAGLNVVWSVCALLMALPILLMSDAIAAIAASLVLGLPLAVVSGATCHFTNQLARGQIATWGLFAQGVRRYWAKSLAVAAVNVLALMVLASNLGFYAFVVAGAWTRVALGAWLMAAIYWALVQIYWFPMILEIKSEKVLEALRRATALVIVSPGFSLATGIVVALVIAACALTVVPVVIVMASLLLLVCNHATRSRLALVQKKPYQPHQVEGS